ncbi:MAG: type II toxin-antitoxin system HicB family antitoxin [Cucumibacter sp.]
MFFDSRLRSNGECGFIATFAAVPEAITEGATRAEALANAGDALEVALFGHIKDGGDLPSPPRGRPGRNAVYLGAQASAKLAL